MFLPLLVVFTACGRNPGVGLNEITQQMKLKSVRPVLSLGSKTPLKSEPKCFDRKNLSENSLSGVGPQTPNLLRGRFKLQTINISMLIDRIDSEASSVRATITIDPSSHRLTLNNTCSDGDAADEIKVRFILSDSIEVNEHQAYSKQTVDFNSGKWSISDTDCPAPVSLGDGIVNFGKMFFNLLQVGQMALSSSEQVHDRNSFGISSHQSFLDDQSDKANVFIQAEYKSQP
jgi:hypothetical protein